MIHIHVVIEEPGPLIELLGPMMGLITAPYLGVRAAEREARRGAERAREIRSGGDYRWSPPVRPDPPTVEARGEIPSLLAPRARECLLFIAEQGGRELSPNNREIALGTGIAYDSQVSRLLSDLRRDGLIDKRSTGVGTNNAWRLTPRGETQNGETVGYNLDPAGRTRETVSTGKTSQDIIDHYAGGGAAPAWTIETPSGSWTRNISGIGGLAAVQVNGATPVLQLTNLHGDVIATAALSETETKLLSTTEFLRGFHDRR